MISAQFDGGEAIACLAFTSRGEESEEAVAASAAVAEEGRSVIMVTWCNVDVCCDVISVMLMASTLALSK